jgi:phosphotransferase system enzyme I (PtsI)
MSPRPVSIRILDIGGEKILAGDPTALSAANSLLGLRALRLALRERDLFETQLRGIMRASAHGNLKILLPFVSGVEQFRQARAVIAEVRDTLVSEGHAVAASIPVGAMIEIPGAAVIADLLAQEADFFSIGSNDLIQYLLAVDRANDAVAHLYEPLHPAVLRVLESLMAMAREYDVPVTMCGEMAADPLTAMMLLGFGMEELSMNAVAIPLIKNVIRKVKRSDAEWILKRALQLRTAREVEEFTFEQQMSLFPEGFLVRD